MAVRAKRRQERDRADAIGKGGGIKCDAGMFSVIVAMRLVCRDIHLHERVMSVVFAGMHDPVTQADPLHQQQSRHQHQENGGIDRFKGWAKKMHRTNRELRVLSRCGVRQATTPAHRIFTLT